MEQNLKNLFKQVVYSPESRLSGDIWSTLVNRNRRNTQTKFWVYSVLSSISFISLFPTLKQLGVSFERSGFYDYFSLAFSDSKLALLHSKEVSLSLVESLPVLNIILFLSIVLIFIMSLRFMVRNIRSSSLLITS